MRRTAVVLAALMTMGSATPWVSAALEADGLAPTGAVTAATDASGFVVDPPTLSLTAQLAAGERAVQVWASKSPRRSADGLPAAGAVASCTATQVVQDASGRATCTIPTGTLEAGVRYSWWVVTETTTPAGESVRTPSAIATISLGRAAGTSARRHVGLELSARLPSRERFDGTRSIKHVVLTRVVRDAMRTLFPSRTLAVGCWTDEEFVDLLASMGTTAVTARSQVDGIWFEAQPRWLHLSGTICSDVERLRKGARSGSSAYALTIAVHEAMHAYGIDDEAKATCYAVQLVPKAATALGIPRRQADALGATAVTATRADILEGYWDSKRCRDGGTWDLASSDVRLGG